MRAVLRRDRSVGNVVAARLGGMRALGMLLAAM
jgi:hypothetical protein